MIGRLSFYFKTANSLDNSDVRISKRPNIPYRRLRGFEKGKIGPIDNADYIGGNYVSAFNLSTNLPGLLSSYENIDLSYFIDMGNVWGVDYNDALDDTEVEKFNRYFIGLFISVGPLSFSWTLPITKNLLTKPKSLDLI